MIFLVGKSSDKRSDSIFSFLLSRLSMPLKRRCAPVKNLLCWKRLQIYDIFLGFAFYALSWQKQEESFLAFNIEFFPRQPWNVTNGSAFVPVVRLVRNDLQCFWDFRRARNFETVFPPSKICYPKLQNRIGKYFSTVGKQFFNQTLQSCVEEIVLQFRLLIFHHFSYEVD